MFAQKEIIKNRATITGEQMLPLSSAITAPSPLGGLLYQRFIEQRGKGPIVVQRVQPMPANYELALRHRGISPARVRQLKLLSDVQTALNMLPQEKMGIFKAARGTLPRRLTDEDLRSCADEAQVLEGVINNCGVALYVAMKCHTTSGVDTSNVAGLRGIGIRPPTPGAPEPYLLLKNNQAGLYASPPDLLRVELYEALSDLPGPALPTA